MTDPVISIIIPAHNEAEFITTCLTAVLASDAGGFRADIIVVANACTDATVARAGGCKEAAAAREWDLRVVDLPEGGKLNALNVGDSLAQGGIRIYLDADVTVSAELLGQLVAVLSTPEPAYASGTPQVAPAQSWITRAYARFWTTLPFVTSGVPGFGIFAVNASGRARWDAFPDIIADDIFVRLQFAPNERHRVAATYQWPMVEGFANLVRVRRRQNAGVNEVAQSFPHLTRNEDKPATTGLFGRFCRGPIGFCIYALVATAVKTPLFRSNSRWARGR